MQQTSDQSAAASHLIQLEGVRPLSPEEIRSRLAHGARLVRFEVCLSVLLFTIRRQSAVFLTESRVRRGLLGLRYSLASLLLGPWGVPWGLIWTPWSVWVNLTGGVDETDAILASLDARDNPSAAPFPPGS